MEHMADMTGIGAGAGTAALTGIDDLGSLLRPESAGVRALARALALAGICAWATSAGAAAAATTASLSPYWIEGHHVSTLAVSGDMEGYCAPLFSHHEAQYADGKLMLSVVVESNPAALCAVNSTSPYRTEFSVPALDSGSHPVTIRWRQACELAPTPCPVAYIVKDLGNITVTDSAHLGYVFTPEHARAGAGIKIHLNGKFNCADQISAVSADTQRPAIYLNFTVNPRPEIACIMPFPGIDFEVPALTAGTYQVFAARSPYCAPGTVCPLFRIAPQLAGALDVESATALAPMRPKAGYANPIVKGGKSGTGFRAEWRGKAHTVAGRRD